ncbi:MAG: alpha-glucan family phosphorylase [Bacteroidales bacterium]|nr:alpha-glucan family phosphorylase [Bacteroidales bacterium]
MTENLIKPDYLFEVSWEVCNKMGGIYTVIATKALFQKSQYGRHHILIGPDVWMHTASNPDFTEDQHLFRSWKAMAARDGLLVRIGRWNIPGKPIAILVDFKKFMPKQHDVLKKLWEDYEVDSITGNWDYKESVLFGYATGMVIKHFVENNVSANETVAAHFHEWQTGSGLLYLKSMKVPVATVFTTHATMIGRCIAGHNLPLYDNLKHYDGDEKAREFGVVSRHSMELKSAQNADVFTTVSDITAAECEQFLHRKPDVVTPNGFENSFTPATDELYDEARSKARAKLLQVASVMADEPLEDKALIVGIGGRYEYRNKGIDVFIDALARLGNDIPRQVVAFIMVPGAHDGPDRTLAACLAGKGPEHYSTQTSHYLSYPDNDQITNRFRECGLDNSVGGKVKIFFIPSYLNGNDGIFNTKYYDLLVGMDLALFPSYYEPWGYTPLEALAFRVPTLTTSLSGFGKWVDRIYGKKAHPGITVVPRNDSNYDQVVDAVRDRILEMASLDGAVRRKYMENAREVASTALWENQIKFYDKAYALALDKSASRRAAVAPVKPTTNMNYNKIEVNAPSWKSVMVTRHLPQELADLEKLSKNLWWCWNDSSKLLFRSIDPEIWHTSGHNPKAILDRVSIKRYSELAKDKAFLGRMKAVMDEFNAYMDQKKDRTEPSVAYFCMEYGLDTSLKIYSGGLGILAGDYLKETSDMNVNLVAVGLLYRYGYFTQVLSSQGYQEARYDAQNFLDIPAEPVYKENGEWLTIQLALPGRNLSARLWKVAVGRTDLYLLDTDFEANRPEDRQITHQLYGGDWENRLKQEILLGIGGIRALRALGISTSVYHCNEGHAAFIGLERLREYIEKKGLTFQEALEVVKASSLFTTHTPVPAGHDAFEEGMIRQYLGHYAQRLGIDWTTMMGLGKLNGADPAEKFSMSKLAANISQNVNGVSMLHGKVSQEIFSNMYPGYLPEELHVSYVTNGVHYPTWAAREWKVVHSEVFGPEFKTYHYDKKCFEGIYGVPDETIWNIRKELKKILIRNVKERLSDTQLSSHYSPKEIMRIKDTLRDDVLTIGFARRFATYKRATLLFTDLDRLDSIVNNPKMPVQFIFAGKAHPADKAGQDLIKRIVDISKEDRFIGKIVFVPGYDITFAKRLVQGVDVWMNNPTRPQEASGTSGEKAAMNGVMHFSVLDGWWVEGYQPGCGWALPQERTYDDQHFQNELDSATIYTIIENEIAPTYYDIDFRTKRSARWIEYIKNCIARVACNFTTNRMLTDYCNQYYIPQSKRANELVANDYELARQIAAWKKNVQRHWNEVEVVSYTQPDATYNLSPDSRFNCEVVLQLGELKPEDIGVEILICSTDRKGNLHIQEKAEFTLVSCEDGIAKYQASILPERTGMYQVTARYFAKNPMLPHRQDFGLVKWL